MELFSEIHNCYYQVMRHLLCSQKALTMEEICEQIRGEGFGESVLSIIPKIEEGMWNLFDKEDGRYLSKLTSSFLTPLSDIQKSYLKALLADPRIGLFLDAKQQEELNAMLGTVSPLWKQDQFFFL